MSKNTSIKNLENFENSFLKNDILEFWSWTLIVSILTYSSNDNSVHNQNMILTLTRPIGVPPHKPVAQKIADQRWLIAYSANNTYFLI